MTVTRKLLERVPEDRIDWKPHAKSMSLGQLAQHVATFRGGAASPSSSRSSIWARHPPPIPSARAPSCSTTFDRLVGDTRGALAGKTDAELMAPWALKKDGHAIFSMPKASVVALLRHQPPRAPPRSAERVSPAARRPGPFDLRSQRRRRPDVSEQRWPAAALGCRRSSVHPARDGQRRRLSLRRVRPGVSHTGRRAGVRTRRPFRATPHSSTSQARFMLFDDVVGGGRPGDRRSLSKPSS